MQRKGKLFLNESFSRENLSIPFWQVKRFYRAEDLKVGKCEIKTLSQCMKGVEIEITETDGRYTHYTGSGTVEYSTGTLVHCTGTGKSTGTVWYRYRYRYSICSTGLK